jgi:hypothetical protein
MEKNFVNKYKDFLMIETREPIKVSKEDLIQKIGEQNAGAVSESMRGQLDG